MTPERKQEINRVAMDAVTGCVVTSFDIPSDFWKMVFMPLSIMSSEELLALAEHTALIYEYEHKALPKAINGMPVFSSLKTINNDEYHYFIERAKFFENERENVD